MQSKLHLLLACALAARIHGTAEAVKATAYRVGQKLPKKQRGLAQLIIQSCDALTLINVAMEHYFEN